eukprot:366017-Chlamydomonas_euryale.AAC.2
MHLRCHGCAHACCRMCPGLFPFPTSAPRRASHLLRLKHHACRHDRVPQRQRRRRESRVADRPGRRGRVGRFAAAAAARVGRSRNCP